MLESKQNQLWQSSTPLPPVLEFLHVPSIDTCLPSRALVSYLMHHIARRLNAPYQWLAGPPPVSCSTSRKFSRHGWSACPSAEPSVPGIASASCALVVVAENKEKTRLYRARAKQLDLNLNHKILDVHEALFGRQCSLATELLRQRADWLWRLRALMEDKIKFGDVCVSSSSLSFQL